MAAVSTRVAEVVNGQPLEVLEHRRRFLKVKTAKNEIGWLPERAVIDSKTYDGFALLASEHKDDPVIATGTLRNDLYMHILPGRDTDRFYLLPANSKVEMLVRASVQRTPLAGSALAPKAPAPTTAAKSGASKQSAEKEPLPGVPQAPPVIMEDWWLVRDAKGQTGWMLGGRLDVDAPLSIAQYAEGQRIVGAYVIANVTDPESDAPNHEVPEYVTALGPPESGLLYDFDQIRVFTWSLKRHRYETAFRLRPIQGYLPIRITSRQESGGSVPVFSFQVSSSPDVTINPDTGIARPAAPRTISYALRDTMVRRVGPDLASIPMMRSRTANAKK